MTKNFVDVETGEEIAEFPFTEAQVNGLSIEALEAALRMAGYLARDRRITHLQIVKQGIFYAASTPTGV